ncbi:phospholipase D-like domain-containing protein [Oligoflexus tunisiensis]|uniref:phospholipase D-like domain-containing protein n=1 Tax=Oligoflexus tunisiensis TaxID=708132 RepID=UPI00114D3BE8|nr:phospholipase D-like domain-containing protein [Oligoflexus tunisiensis]
MHRLLPAFLALCALTQPGFSASEEAIHAPQAPVPVPGFSLKNTANFDELRHNVLELIGSSKKRVWLITDYLTDGDVVSALFLAKYRKVDVKVLLGRSKQNQYLSRLSYLKAQDIPVFTRPEHGFVAPTLVFVDQKLYTINRDLNSLAHIGQAQIAQASPADVKNFVSWFRDTLEYPVPAVVRPEMQVGRSRNRPAESRRSSPVAEETPVSRYDGEPDGSYNYDRSSLSRRPPEGVPTQLPRIPVWQKNRDIRQKNPPILPLAPNPPVPADRGTQPGPTAPTPVEAVSPDNPAPTGQFPEEHP